MVNKASPVPIYYQLKEKLKEQIESGSLKSGDLLPSENELSAMYQISRMTARQAIENLVQEGFIYRVKGRGTFVAEKKIEQRIQGLNSFSEDMISRGMKPSSELVSFRIAKALKNVQSALSLKDGAEVYEIERVRLADSVPIALEISYFPTQWISGLKEEDLKNSLYKFLEEKVSLRIESAEQSLEASVANNKESEALHIEKGAPVLILNRKSVLVDGTPIELTKSVYRADRYKYLIELKRQPN